VAVTKLLAAGVHRIRHGYPGRHAHPSDPAGPENRGFISYYGKEESRDAQVIHTLLCVLTLIIDFNVPTAEWDRTVVFTPK
jgi:hypothetical protein